MKVEISDIGHAVQLAIAPVFLLAALGTMLVVLTNRLGRIIDRTRVLEALRPDQVTAAAAAEIRTLYRRAYMINYAIWLCTICGLLVCLVIATLFLNDTTTLPVDRVIALLFILAMLSMLGGFIFFLCEISIACRYMRAQQMAALAHPYRPARAEAG